MSWENDLLDDSIVAFKQHGGVLDQVRTIRKGVPEQPPEDIGSREYPLLYGSWVGSEEENYEVDNRPDTERYRTATLVWSMGVYEHDSEKRVETLTELVETVSNAIYDNEEDTGGLVLDEINISSVEVFDEPTTPYAFAFMEVEYSTWFTRTGRTGDS
jgi:hypothetical protein